MRGFHARTFHLWSFNARSEYNSWNSSQRARLKELPHQWPQWWIKPSQCLNAVRVYPHTPQYSANLPNAGQVKASKIIL